MLYCPTLILLCSVYHLLGESTKLNDENNFCFHFGMITDGNGDESRYPEDLSSFLALLESIPLQYAESSFGSFEHVKPDMRYDRIFLCLSSLPLSSVNIVWESFVSFWLWCLLNVSLKCTIYGDENWRLLYHGTLVFFFNFSFFFVESYDSAAIILSWLIAYIVTCFGIFMYILFLAICQMCFFYTSLYYSRF